MTERRQFPPLKHWRDIRDKVWAILALVLAILAIGKPDMQAAQATEQIVRETVQEPFVPIEEDGKMFPREIDLLGQSLDVPPEFVTEWNLEQIRAELRRTTQPRARAILEAEKARLMAELEDRR